MRLLAALAAPTDGAAPAAGVVAKAPEARGLAGPHNALHRLHQVLPGSKVVAAVHWISRFTPFPKLTLAFLTSMASASLVSVFAAAALTEAMILGWGKGGDHEQDMIEN